MQTRPNLSPELPATTLLTTPPVFPVDPPVLAPPGALAPFAPSALQAQAAPGLVQLTWQDNSLNEDGIKVRRRGPTDTGFVDIAILGPNATAYADATTQPNTTYTYRVRAFNAAGGAVSNDAVVTTPPAGGAIAVPLAPGGLTATALSPTQVALAWQDNSGNEDGFKVKRQGPGETAFTDIASLPANATGYTDSGAQPGRTYTYRVRAFNAAGGAVSNEAAVATPANDLRKSFTMDSRAGNLALVAGASTTFVAGRFEKFTNGIPTLDFVNASASISPAEPSIGLSLSPGNPIESFQAVSLTITTTTDTPAQAYVVTINGASAEDGQPYSPGRIPVTVTPPPKVVLDVAPGMQTVRAGTPARYEVRLQRDAFTQGAQVELSVNESRLPPGVRVSFDPPALNGNRSTMTVTTERVDLPDTIDLRVRGRTPGVQVMAADARLKIQPEVALAVAPPTATLDAGQSRRFDFTVVRMGYAGSLMLAVDFREPKPLFAAVTMPANFSAGSAFQADVQVKEGTARGSYRLFARAVFPGGASVLSNEAEVPVEVRARGLLQLAADRSGVALAPGDTENLAIGLSAIMPSGLQGRVELSLDTADLPQGVRVKFDGEEDRVLVVDRAAASLLDITADALAAGGGSFTVNGRFLDGPDVEVRAVTVTVQALAAASVVVDFFGPVRSVEQGQTAAYTLLLKAVNYAGDVSLSVPDLPPGVPQAAFGANPVRVSSAQDPVPVALSFDTAGVPVGTFLFSVLGTAVPSAQVIVLRDGTLDVTPAPVPLPPPAIDGFSPASGTVATPVTITGENFAAGAQVTFNGVAATASVASATRIETAVPLGASRGRIGVKTTGAVVLSDAEFDVLTAGAVALSVTPAAVAAAPGQRLRYVVGLARTGFAGPVQLAVEGLPPGSVVGFGESPTLGNQVALDVQLPARAAAGAYTLTVTGRAAGLTIEPVSTLLKLKARVPDTAPELADRAA